MNVRAPVGNDPRCLQMQALVEEFKFQCEAGTQNEWIITSMLDRVAREMAAGIGCGAGLNPVIDTVQKHDVSVAVQSNKAFEQASHSNPEARREEYSTQDVLNDPLPINPEPIRAAPPPVQRSAPKNLTDVM